MKIWYLGDAQLSSQLQSVAAALNLELVDSSVPSATMEHVWTKQVHEKLFRVRKKDDCFAILFVNNPDYDSEVLIHMLLHRITEASKIILVVHPSNAKAAEGMTAHWEGERFILIALDDLTDLESALLQKLQ